MQSIIFISLSVAILSLILYIGINAILRGIRSKNNKDFDVESTEKNRITDELLKLNNLLESGAITEDEFKKSKKKILDLD